MGGLERLFTLLSDGRWYGVQDLTKELDWTIERTKRVVEFLDAHRLVSYQPSVQKVKIDEQLRALIFSSETSQ